MLSHWALGVHLACLLPASPPSAFPPVGVHRPHSCSCPGVPKQQTFQVLGSPACLWPNVEILAEMEGMGSAFSTILVCFVTWSPGLPDIFIENVAVALDLCSSALQKSGAIPSFWHLPPPGTCYKIPSPFHQTINKTKPYAGTPAHSLLHWPEWKSQFGFSWDLLRIYT